MSRLSVGLGLAVVAFALAVGAIDGLHAARDWSTMGPLPPGSTIGSFRVRTLDGAPLDGEALQGRVTVLTFWATWCPACRDELGDLDELAGDYADAPVAFIAVDHEGIGLEQAAAVARRYRDARGLRLPVAIDDGSMAGLFRVGPIPHTVVLDAGGTIRYVHQGRVRADTLSEEVDGLLAGG